MSGEIFTAEQLADRWQVKVAWVYAKTRSGDIPKVPLPGRYYRYRLDVIEAFERADLDSPEEAAYSGPIKPIGPRGRGNAQPRA